MRTWTLVTAVIVAFSPAARADDTASIAYQQADALAKQGKWTEACPFYEASYRADPEIGVLLHLADCHEHVGRFASAWAEFNDAVALAHRKGDNREALAQRRADALKPRLAYLHVTAPPAPPPGLVVRRDGVDVTMLVGTDMPIDPGAHALSASAPGFAAWQQTVTIGGAPATTTVAIPPLVGAAPPVAAPHRGHVTITSMPGAHIALDTVELGVGRYDGDVSSGGHQLRVTAPGMRPYQTELYVADGEQRAVEVTLEREPAAVVVAPPAPPIARFGGLRVFAGSSFDGLDTQASNCGGGQPGMYCGHGIRSVPGIAVGLRVRVNLAEHWSFDPGAGLHLRHIYFEMCAPCMETDDVAINQLEAFALFRYQPTTGRVQLGLLAGPFAAARFRVFNNFMLPTGAPDPTEGAAGFDFGAALAVELFYGRFGAQIMFEQGFQNLSTMLDAPTQSLGAQLGFRI